MLFQLLKLYKKYTLILLTKTKNCDNIQNIQIKYSDEDKRFSKNSKRVGDGARPIISLKLQITSE